MDRSLEVAEAIVAPMFDAAILGGGPAGCAAAISLRRLCPSLRIALLESSEYEEWRVGETLSPAAHELLRGLGCWEQFRKEAFLESFGTLAAWGRDRLHENDFLFSGRGNGWHLDRNRFDALLCHAAEQAGVHIARQSRFLEAKTTQHEDAWLLTLRRNGQSENVQARFVIDATGRRAAFAARQGARWQIHDHLVGIAMMVQLRPGEISESRTLVESQEDGWWYVAPLPGEKAVVSWMSDADLIRKKDLGRKDAWVEHLSCSRFARNCIGAATPDGSLRVWCAQSRRLDRPSGKNWVATGDAAGVFDPLSSAGILKALRWGKVASFAAANYFAGRPFSDKYEAFLCTEYASYLDARKRYYRMEGRWPASAFWSRRIHEPA